jgi:hypothetical protein
MSAQSLEAGLTSVCRATGCGDPELLVSGAILLAVVLLATGVTLVRLREAREAVATERRRAVAERDAFAQFRRRVARLETSSVPVDDPPTGRPSAVTGTTGETAVDARAAGTAGAHGGSRPTDCGSADGLRAVQTAYAETVLATPHHDTEYGETVTESMAAEFSCAVATTVADGSALTPALQATLLRGADAAGDCREALVSRLDAERCQLQEATDVLEPAAEAAAAVRTDEADVDDCVAASERLDWHESAVTDLTTERQREVHARVSDHPNWFDYVYGDLDATHPILATATETLAAIDDTRDRLARTVADG